MPNGLRFALLHRAFRRQMDESVKEFDLTAVQFSVLVQLGRLNRKGHQDVNQTMLENAAHITHATMTEILKKLQKKGFITLSVAQSDRRSKSITATEKCDVLRQAVGQCDEYIFSKLCQGLSEEQISALLTCTDIMLANARNMMTAMDDAEKGGERS